MLLNFSKQSIHANCTSVQVLIVFMILWLEELRRVKINFFLRRSNYWTYCTVTESSANSKIEKTFKEIGSPYSKAGNENILIQRRLLTKWLVVSRKATTVLTCLATEKSPHYIGFDMTSAGSFTGNIVFFSNRDAPDIQLAIYPVF